MRDSPRIPRRLKRWSCTVRITPFPVPLLWVRPAKMFFETIERNGKRMKRFELLEEKP